MFDPLLFHKYNFYNHTNDKFEYIWLETFYIANFKTKKFKFEQVVRFYFKLLIQKRQIKGIPFIY